MKDLVQFINQFLHNKGLFVFLSILVEKIVGLVNTIFVVRLISQEDYGLITLIAALFGVFITFNGLGSVQGLLRYGALAKDVDAKQKLSQYIFKHGLRRHLVLLLVFIIVALFYELKYESIWMIIGFFGLRMFGYYIYSFVLNYYRVLNRNDYFAKISMIINGIGLVMAIALTYGLGTYGYLLGLALTPWLSLFFIPRSFLQHIPKIIPHLDTQAFWKFSFNSSATYFLSELLFMLDVFLIGLLLNEAAVAQYKVAIILPMNLMFIPMIFMQTDYPKLVENSNNRDYLHFYIRNYYKLFIPLVSAMLFMGYWLKDWIVSFVFGSAYIQQGSIFYIILIAIAFNMCFRNLYGNLLSAVGLAHLNSRVAALSLLMMSILGYYLISVFAIRGAAIALAITFITMGMYSAYLFYSYLNHLPKNEDH